MLFVADAILTFIIVIILLNQWWWWWFSARRQVHWLLRHLGMRWVISFPVAFFTNNYRWATCPMSLRMQWL